MFGNKPENAFNCYCRACPGIRTSHCRHTCLRYKGFKLFLLACLCKTPGLHHALFRCIKEHAALFFPLRFLCITPMCSYSLTGPPLLRNNRFA